MQKVLEDLGGKVSVTKDGKKARDILLKKEFDLVLMDVQIPVMDGWTATRKIRESGYSKPIISLTAGALKEDKEKSLDAGMDDYLSKPIQMDELKSVLKKYLD